MTTDPANPPDAMHLTPEQAAQLLGAAANIVVSADSIRKHVTQGAPSHADGTLNLVHYAAWLTRELTIE